MRLIVLLLSMMVSYGSTAEWVKVRGFPETGITVYADPATVRRSGDRVKMWDLYDYKTTQVSGRGKRYLSSKGQGEYDCQHARARDLFFTRHSGNMGYGSVVASTPNGNIKERDNWNPVSPETLEKNLWNLACGKN